MPPRKRSPPFKGGRDGAGEVGSNDMTVPAGNMLQQSGPCFEGGECSSHVVGWSLIGWDCILNCVELLSRSEASVTVPD